MSFILRLSFFLLLLVSACTTDPKQGFVLPRNIQLSTGTLFNPLFAGNIIDPPIKTAIMWNDSLIDLCLINRMSFIHRGKKSPDHPAEKVSYLFDRKRNLTEFIYFNYEFSAKPYSKIYVRGRNESQGSIDIPLFYGKKDHQKIVIERSSEEIKLIRTKENELNDTTLFHLHNGVIDLVIEKFGSFVSKVNFIVDINQPVSNLKNKIKRYAISDADFLLAERVLTFTENKLPVKSYLIDEFMVKGDMSEVWEYENHKKLISYKKLINNQSVKDIEFEYSENKLMSAFYLNRKKYEVIYE